MKYDADPLAGWPLREVFEMAMPATKDIYGSLFFYLQGEFRRFCEKIKTIKVSIQLFRSDGGRQLPDLLSKHGMGLFFFDRIEVCDTPAPS